MASFSIPGNTHSTVSSIGNLFNFISDFKNFESILPEDKVENFQYSGEQCSFNIRGITPMTIRLVEKKPSEYILFSSEGLAKFNFHLEARFTGKSDETGTCSVNLSGDMNPFILKMAEKSLQSLVNTMSLKLSQLQV